MRVLAPACGALVAALGIEPAAASGFAVEHQNAKAMGAAYAGAQAQNADAGYAAYNPAAISGLARAEAASSATILWGESEYENADAVLLGAFPAGGLAADDGVLPPAFVAGSAIAAPITERLSLGLTVTTPFGLRSKYDVNSAARYYAHEASLLTIAVAPTAAYALTPEITVGASLKIEYMDLTASTVIDAGGVAFLNSVPGFAPGSSDLFAEFKGTDTALGFTAGVQAVVAEGVRFGFTYASKTRHDFDGDVSFTLAGSPAAGVLNSLTGLFADSRFASSLTFPASYAVGVAIEPGAQLTLLASWSLTRWSAFDQVTFDFENPAQPPEIITANWKDSMAVSAGAEWRFSERTAVRGGFSYDETPVDDRFAAPRIPDTDRRWLTAGVSRRLTERIDVDLAGGAVVFPKTRPIRLDGSAPGDLLRGALDADIKTETFAASARLRYRF